MGQVTSAKYLVIITSYFSQKIMPLVRVGYERVFVIKVTKVTCLLCFFGNLIANYKCVCRQKYFIHFHFISLFCAFFIGDMGWLYRVQVDSKYVWDVWGVG